MFRKAERLKAKLRLAITGPAGSGKTYGALLIAKGLGGKIAMIDTESGSGDLYSDLTDYDIQNINAPFTVQKYITAIHEAENEGYDILIIDSLSHVWSGEGGLLDMQGKITDTGKGNSYTAWRHVTPWYNKLVDTMLNSNCHIIATMRSKTEYAQIQNERGKTEIKKLGLAPVQRDGMDYEFTTVFDISMTHDVTVSKDRTSIFDGKIFVISEETGKILRNWLESGKELNNDLKTPSREIIKNLYNSYLEISGNDQQRAQDLMLAITNGKNSKDWDDNDIKNLTDNLSHIK